MDTFLGIVILIISVVVHEVAHGYAANSLGDPTARLAGRLTLNPLPHIDLVGSILLPAFLTITNSQILFGWAKPVPYNPYNLTNQRWGEAFVAVAGSATNLFLAVVFGLMVRFSAELGLSNATTAVAAMISSINLLLGLFNLIPFPPLDGFTALRSALPWNLASKLGELEHRLRTIGIFSLILILLLFSFVFAAPFFKFVSMLFALLTGQPLQY